MDPKAGGKRKADDAEPNGAAGKAARKEEPSPAAAAAAAATTGGTGMTTAVQLQYAVSADMGTRPAMEDVHVCVHDEGAVRTQQTVSHFAVFDGHGGRDCAEYVAAHLHNAVLAAGLVTAKQAQQQLLPAACSGRPLAAAEGAAGAPAGEAADGNPNWQLDIKVAKQAVIKGFLATDQQLLEQCGANNWQDGATAVAVWLVGDTALVANVGDAKCVLARTSAKAGSSAQLKALVLTKDHLAMYPGERSRINKAGGSVSSDGRLNGRIQVSRAFGDAQFKPFGSSASPDITAFSICERDRFMLCGCDGFWAVMDPQGAVELVQQQLEQSKPAKAITNRLLNEAVIERRCKDNCSVMLIVFNSNRQQQQQGQPSGQEL